MSYFRFTVFAAGIGMALILNTALAQKLYKHVDANGVVTYTDLPDKPKDTPMAVGNTKRNGDHTERQNSNLTRLDNESQQEFEQRLASQRWAAQRQQASENRPQQNTVQLYRQSQSVPPPSARDSTRD
jgi:hypothetical protein